jgi:tyrosyl-tRNA synthetase
LAQQEQSLSFLEFNYMILQAYDFLELSRRQDCVLQMGGSDQWGNIVNGVELGRRIDDRALYGLTTPLITTSAGTKMGKTAAGAVWINADMVSPYDYWQYWRNTRTAISRFLKLFTDCRWRSAAGASGLEINGANAATKRPHSRMAAKPRRRRLGGAADLRRGRRGVSRSPICPLRVRQGCSRL